MKTKLNIPLFKANFHIFLLNLQTMRKEKKKFILYKQQRSRKHLCIPSFPYDKLKLNTQKESKFKIRKSPIQIQIEKLL